MNRGNKHHVQFPRALHEAHPDTKDIRRNQWLIPEIDIDVHTALHGLIAIVPVLDRYTAARVRRDFVPIKGSYIGSIHELMSTIDEASRHPKAGPIEFSNAQVAIHALELQIPFIREGLITHEQQKSLHVASSF